MQPDLSWYLLVAQCLVTAVFQFATGGTIVPLLKRCPLPFLAVVASGAAIVLLHTQPGDFYYGAADFGLSLTTLLGPSLAYGATVTPAWVVTVQYTAFPLLLIAAVAIGFVSIRKRVLNTAMAGTTLAFSVIALFVGHQVAGVPYPWTRTGLYLIWLFLVALLSAWEFTRGKGRWVFAGASILLAGLFGE